MQHTFKVGQRVRVADVDESDLLWTRGLVGTVKSPVGRLFLVEFTEQDADGQGHSGAFGDDAKTRWNIEPEYLTPVSAPTIASDMRLTPQAKSVLKHLKSHGRISPLKALGVYGISRLASCIHEIRHKAGYDVTTTIRRDEQGHKYSSYALLAN